MIGCWLEGRIWWFALGMMRRGKCWVMRKAPPSFQNWRGHWNLPIITKKLWFHFLPFHHSIPGDWLVWLGSRYTAKGLRRLVWRREGHIIGGLTPRGGCRTVQQVSNSYGTGSVYIEKSKDTLNQWRYVKKEDMNGVISSSPHAFFFFLPNWIFIYKVCS